MKKLFLFLAICLPVLMYGQRSDIYRLRPGPDSLDQMIVPRVSGSGYIWKKTPTATWWANLSDSTKAYILSGAGGGSPGTGTEDYVTRWIDSTTLGIGVIRDDSSTVGIRTTPTEAQMTTKAVQQPVRVSNFVAQQTFADNTNWTEGAGWLIGAGVAAATATTGDLTYIPAITIVPGNAYEVIYTLSGYSAGTVTIKMGDGTYTVPSYNHTGTTVIIPTSATGGFRLDGGTAFTGSFDNITVHEITLPATIQYAGQLSTASTLYGHLVIPNSTSVLVGGGGRYATGVQNTSFGDGSLLSLSSGGTNSAFGYRALYSNTTGSANTAIGYTALQANLSASHNTAIGYAALAVNTTGTTNTAVGRSSLGANTTGSLNTAMGMSSLQSNTTGGNNTGFGYGTMTLVTTGSYNTTVGVEALGNSTTGAGNSCLGYLAGKFISGGAAANTVPDSSVFVGINSRALASGQTNQIVIGAVATGKGSNTAVIGNSSVTVLWLAGTIGWFQGTGDPENVVTAPVGSFFSRTDGGAGSSWYVKESGAGNTGWQAK